jgi:hypothetical protein
MRALARAGLLVLLVVGAAHAQEACRADVERLCAGIPPGKGRIPACLKANAAQLSPACKAELDSVAQKVRDVQAACRDDAANYCAGVKTGEGNMLRCLRENRSMLSPGCQAVLTSAQEKASAFRKACGKDAKKLCKGITPGEGRVLSCLKSREAELSPNCKALMGS